MKNLLAILFMLTLLSGCGTIGSVRRSVFSDEGIDGKDKVDYAQFIEEKESEFRKYKEQNRGFMPFHYFGATLFFGGVLFAILGKTTKDEGALAAFGGLTASAWGYLAPKYVVLPIGVLVLFIAMGVLIIVNEMFLKPRQIPTT